MMGIVELIFSMQDEIKAIAEAMQKNKIPWKERFSATWADRQDVMQMLHVSQRTLQTLRDSGALPFSRINGKFYYRISDIEALLEANYSGENNKDRIQAD